MILPAAAIFLAAGAVYLNALPNGFVYDDRIQVLENIWIRDARHLPEIFTRSVWSYRGGIVSNYYRPLMHVFYLATYGLAGPSAWSFHLANVALHAGASLLVFFLAVALLGQWEPARSLRAPFLGALLFAVHPAHTEAVSWIAGLPDVSCALFVLVSLLLYLRATAAERLLVVPFTLSVVAFVLAALCKEPALTLPAIVFAAERLSRPGAPRTRALGRVFPYVIVAAAYLVLRRHALGGFAPRAEQHLELSTYEMALNVCPLFARYVGTLLLPIRLNFYHVLHPVRSLLDPVAVGSIVVAGAVAVGMIVGRRRLPMVTFGCVLLAVPLAPVLHIPWVGDNTFAERYLYLPSVGWALLWAWALARADRDARRPVGFGLAAAALVLAGAFAAGTVSRNAAWRDDYTIFTDTVEKSPDSDVVHNLLGNALLERGRIDEAVEHYRAAAAINPGNPKVYANLGVVALRRGALDEAVRQFERAVTIAPGLIEARNNLGYAYARSGQLARAVEQYRAALAVNPNYPEALLNLGQAYLDLGRPAEAVAQFQAAVALRPDQAEYHHALGRARERSGNLDTAILNYEEALRLDSRLVGAHNDLGIVYAERGRIDRAVEHFEAAVRLAPDDPAARRNLERARERGGGGTPVQLRKPRAPDIIRDGE